MAEVLGTNSQTAELPLLDPKTGRVGHGTVSIRMDEIEHQHDLVTLKLRAKNVRSVWRAGGRERGRGGSIEAPWRGWPRTELRKLKSCVLWKPESRDFVENRKLCSVVVWGHSGYVPGFESWMFLYRYSSGFHR